METFATLVQQGREAAGLSYQRVAELVGRAPSTIRGWERGRSEPKDAEVVIALAAVLDLPEDVLLESVELSRSSSSIGGSFSDLAPSDLGEPGAVPAEVDEAVVVDAGVSGRLDLSRGHRRSVRRRAPSRGPTNRSRTMTGLFRERRRFLGRSRYGGRYAPKRTGPPFPRSPSWCSRHNGHISRIVAR